MQLVGIDMQRQITWLDEFAEKGLRRQLRGSTAELVREPMSKFVSDFQKAQEMQTQLAAAEMSLADGLQLAKTTHTFTVIDDALAKLSYADARIQAEGISK